MDIGAVEVSDAPRVVDVIISGSNSIHDAYSFSEAFSQVIHEFTTVPVGNADTIEVVFSEWVDVEESDLWLYGGYTGIEYTSAWNIVDYAFDDDTFTARWRFDDPADGDTLANPFPADNLVLMLESTGEDYIADASGNKLDGEWAFPLSLAATSPTSFPSGNGIEGGSFLFTFVILPGDINPDNVVDGVDYALFVLNIDPEVTDNTFTDGDFDGDGDLDLDDLLLWFDNAGLDFTSWNYGS